MSRQTANTYDVTCWYCYKLISLAQAIEYYPPMPKKTDRKIMVLVCGGCWRTSKTLENFDLEKIYESQGVFFE